MACTFSASIFTVTIIILSSHFTFARFKCLGSLTFQPKKSKINLTSKKERWGRSWSAAWRVLLGRAGGVLPVRPRRKQIDCAFGRAAVGLFLSYILLTIGLYSHISIMSILICEIVGGIFIGEIGARVHQLLQEKHLTGASLGKYAKISTGNISDWKNKCTNPSSDKLALISEFLGVSVDYLVTGKEESPSSQLRDDELELLKYYNALPTREQGRLLGQLEKQAEEATPRPRESAG